MFVDQAKIYIKAADGEKFDGLRPCAGRHPPRCGGKMGEGARGGNPPGRDSCGPVRREARGGARTRACRRAVRLCLHRRTSDGGP